MKVNKRDSKASVICDRTGFRYPMRDMVVEPGTNYLVHKSVSDGSWSLTEHPLANMSKYLRGKSGDPFAIPDARPDINWSDPIEHTATAVLSGSGELNCFTTNGDWSGQDWYATDWGVSPYEEGDWVEGDWNQIHWNV
jgi:hypothetical protein